MSLNNEKCKTRPFLTDLDPVKLKYYPFMITWDKCNGSCNTLSKISDRVCVPHKTKNLKLNAFNLITRTNKSKALIKRVSCKCNVNLTINKCNSNQICINNKCWCECKNKKKKKTCAKKVIFGILLHVVVKMVDMQKELLTI